VVDIFLREAPRLVADLNRVIPLGNAEALTRAAHSLKGELGYFGLAEASQKARELEEMGRNGNLQNATDLLNRLTTEVSHAMTGMRSWRSARNAPKVDSRSASVGS
jgi:HPt (histidine-containing phosphotransfer) domain-containing protein